MVVQVTGNTNGFVDMRDIVSMILGAIDRGAHFRRLLADQYGAQGLGKLARLDYRGDNSLVFGFVHIVDKEHCMFAGFHDMDIQAVAGSVAEGVEWDETD